MLRIFLLLFCTLLWCGHLSSSVSTNVRTLELPSRGESRAWVTTQLGSIKKQLLNSQKAAQTTWSGQVYFWKNQALLHQVQLQLKKNESGGFPAEATTDSSGSLTIATENGAGEHLIASREIYEAEIGSEISSADALAALTESDHDFGEGAGNSSEDGTAILYGEPKESLEMLTPARYTGKVITAGYAPDATVCIEKSQGLGCQDALFKTTTDYEGSFSLDFDSGNSSGVLVAEVQANRPDHENPILHRIYAYSPVLNLDNILSPLSNILAISNDFDYYSLKDKLGIDENFMIRFDDPIAQLKDNVDSNVALINAQLTHLKDLIGRLELDVWSRIPSYGEILDIKLINAIKTYDLASINLADERFIKDLIEGWNFQEFHLSADLKADLIKSISAIIDSIFAEINSEDVFFDLNADVDSFWKQIDSIGLDISSGSELGPQNILSDLLDSHAVDSDIDGVLDIFENLTGTNPHDSEDTPLDSDYDGLPDSLELIIGTNPNTSDSDDDGTPDLEEEDTRKLLLGELGYPEDIHKKEINESY